MKRTTVHRQHNRRTQCSYCHQYFLLKEEGVIRISVDRLIDWDAIINGRFCTFECAIKYLQEAEEKRKKKHGILTAEVTTTKDDCQACKRYNDFPEICFDYPELNILKARENCSIHNKEDVHGL